MGLNTQFPSWITESRIAEAQLGQQLGRNILEGLRFQEQKRQDERRVPLLNAQTELANANVAAQLLQNQQNVIAANRQNEARAALTSALALDSEITRSGKWTDPENQAKFIDFLEKNPVLVSDPWANSMRDRFSAAEKMAFEKTKYQELIKGREEVAKLRYQFNDRDTSQASWQEFTNLMGQGYDEVEAFKTLRDNAAGSYSGIVKRNADAIISQLSALKREGVPYSQTDVEEFWSKISTGGGSVMADRKAIEEAKSEDKSYMLLNQAANEIEAFDRKYGKGAFDDYVGPIDARRLKFQNAVIRPTELPEANREANKIFQKVNQVIQGYRKNQFGTALTATETAAFKDIISDPTFANYAESMRNFRDNLGDSLGYSINQYKLSPLLPIDIKKRWATAYQGVGGAAGQPANIPTGQAPMTPQAAPAQGGVKILSITPLP